jgi:hypothetical protein
MLMFAVLICRLWSMGDFLLLTMEDTCRHDVNFRLSSGCLYGSCLSFTSVLAFASALQAMCCSSLYILAGIVGFQLYGIHAPEYAGNKSCMLPR